MSFPQGAPPEIAFDQPARTPQRRDQATHQRRRHLPQRKRNHTARRRNPSRAERRVGRLKEIHDTGIHRSDERQSHTQAAHRGSLSVPALPAGYRDRRQALTPPDAPFGANYLINSRFLSRIWLPGKRFLQLSVPRLQPQRGEETCVGLYSPTPAFRALRPRKTAYDVRDGQLRGFGVRVLPSGRKRFFVHCQHRGETRLEDRRRRRDHGTPAGTLPRGRDAYRDPAGARTRRAIPRRRSSTPSPTPCSSITNGSGRHGPFT